MLRKIQFKEYRINLIIFVKSFSESNFSVEVVSYLLAYFFKEIHNACFYVYKNCITFSTLFISSTENGSSFELFDTATMEIIGFTSETILCISDANSLNWAVSFHTFSGIMRCSLCIGFFFVLAQKSIQYCSVKTCSVFSISACLPPFKQDLRSSTRLAFANWMIPTRSLLDVTMIFIPYLNCINCPCKFNLYFHKYVELSKLNKSSIYLSVYLSILYVFLYLLLFFRFF